MLWSFPQGWQSVRICSAVRCCVSHIRMTWTVSTVDYCTYGLMGGRTRMGSKSKQKIYNYWTTAPSGQELGLTVVSQWNAQVFQGLIPRQKPSSNLRCNIGFFTSVVYLVGYDTFQSSGSRWKQLLVLFSSALYCYSAMISRPCTSCCWVN